MIRIPLALPKLVDYTEEFNLHWTEGLSRMMIGAPHASPAWSFLSAWLHSTFRGLKDLQGWWSECWKRRKSGRIVLPCMQHRYRGTLRWCCFREEITVDERPCSVTLKSFPALEHKKERFQFGRESMLWLSDQTFKGMMLCSLEREVWTRVKIEWLVLQEYAAPEPLHIWRDVWCKKIDEQWSVIVKFCFIRACRLV